MTASRALGAGALDLWRGWRAMQDRVPAAAAGACCALEGGFVAALAAGDRGNGGAELSRNRDVAPGAGRGPQGRAREAAGARQIFRKFSPKIQKSPKTPKISENFGQKVRSTQGTWIFS